MNIAFFIAGRYLFAKKSTQAINIISYISIIGVCVGSAALFIILSVFNGFEELNLKFYKQLNPDLRISKTDESDFDYAEIKALMMEPATHAHVVQVYENYALLKYLQTPFYSKIKGVSEEFLSIHNLDSSIAAGKFIFEDQYADYIVLGGGVAYQLGIDVRQSLDALSVFAPKPETKLNAFNPEAALNRLELYPGGIFSVKQEMDNTGSFVSLHTAEKLFETKGLINAVEIYLDDESAMSTLKKQLADLLPEGYVVKDRFQLNATLYKVLNSERWAVYLILTFILTVAICNIIGAITMLIIDKKKDIAILSALGLSSNGIRRVYLIQGLLIAFVGLLIGLLIGSIFVFLQMKYGLISIAGSEDFIISAYPVKLIYTDYLLVFGTVMLISLLAAWFSSKQVEGMQDFPQDMA